MSATRARRVFRVDTPSDVLCAAMVAGALPPGDDILCYTTDRAYGPKDDYIAALRSVASFHPWAHIIDISGIPILRHLDRPVRTVGAKLRRARDTAKSVDFLRRRLAPALGLTD